MAEFVRTHLGGAALHFEGHKYLKIREGKNGMVFWRCSQHKPELYVHVFVKLISWELISRTVDFVRVDLMGVDLVRVDLEAPNPVIVS